MQNFPGPRRPPLRRIAAEFITLVSTWGPPDFASVDRRSLAPGDGHAVLMLPPTFRGDTYTAAARAFLDTLGYATYGWDLGVNRGPTAGLIAGAVRRLNDLSDRHGPVSLVGYSLGGLFARLLALRHPERVRGVITVCSPIDEPARSVWFPLEPLLGLWPGVDLRRLSEEIAATPQVPSTCIYSCEDGIVWWASCRDVHGADNVQVAGCHVTMGRNPEALSIIAERLSRRPSAAD